MARLSQLFSSSTHFPVPTSVPRNFEGITLPPLIHRSRTTLLHIDFGDHDIATRAIRALNNAEVDGYILKACWHKDVGLYIRQWLTYAR
jgi:hypothetical protein